MCALNNHCTIAFALFSNLPPPFLPLLLRATQMQSNIAVHHEVKNFFQTKQTKSYKFLYRNVLALACILPKEEGASSGGLPRNKFYYNSATNECESLSYSGTGGNANNFDTKQQCESYCKTGIINPAIVNSRFVCRRLSLNLQTFFLSFNVH